MLQAWREFSRCAATVAAVACATACAQSRHASDEFATLVTALRSHSVVLLGEVHDNAAQHALRARALRTLMEGGARPAIAMEQFDRERQSAIDAVLARPGASVREVIAAGSADGHPMAGWDWPLYEPYIALALEYRLPLVAANVSRTDALRAMREGLQPLGFDAAVPKDIVEAQAQEIVAGHCGMIDARQAGAMVSAQEARDQFMARVVEANAGRGVVLLAGDGHVRRDFGVPRWLTPTTRARSISIGLVEQAEGASDAGTLIDGSAAFDVAVSTPAQTREDPCAEMRAPSASAPMRGS